MAVAKEPGADILLRPAGVTLNSTKRSDMKALLERKSDKLTIYYTSSPFVSFERDTMEAWTNGVPRSVSLFMPARDAESVKKLSMK